MFQLDEQLREWSNRFSQTGSMRRGDVEELENHVRDSVVALTANGLDEQEAFLIATRRLGDQDSLSREFRKINGHGVWARRAFWMTTGCLVFELIRLLFTMVASLGQACASLAGANGIEMSLVSLGAGVACCGLMAAWLVRWHSNSEQDSYARARAVLNLNGFVIGGCLVLAVLTAKLIQTGSYMVIARHTPIEEFGRAAVIQAWSNGVLTLLLPSTLLIVVLKLHREYGSPSNVARTS